MSFLRKKDIICLAAIIVLLFCFYPKLFMLKGAWLESDYREQHFPWANHLSEVLKEGELPFWTNEIQSGFPLVAEGQIAAFYMPNMILYRFLPIKQAYSFSLIFHLFFSGAMMFFFLRHLKLGRFASLFASAVYLFGSTFGGAFYNINSLKVLCWLPLVLMMIDFVIEKKKILYAVILTFAFTQMLLAGYIQFTVYACLFAGIYFLVKVARKVRESGAGKSFLVVVLSFLASIIITLPQHLLTYELYIRSVRSNIGEGFSYLGSFSPLAGICFFIPNMDAVFSGKLYMGVISIFFFILGVMVLIRKKDFIFPFLALIAMLLALGMFSPLYVGIVKILKFYAFRVPMKFLMFFGFFFSIITAYGVNSIKEPGEETKRRLRTATAWFTSLAAASVGVFLTMAVALRGFYAAVYGIGSHLIEKYIYAQPGHPYSLERYLEKLESFLSGAKELIDPVNPNFIIPFVVIIISLLLIYAFRRGILSVKVFLALALILVVTDLHTYTLDPSFENLRDYESYDTYFKEPEVAKFLKENGEKYRIFTFSDNVSGLPLVANHNMVFDIDSANVYSPLVLKRYYRFFGEMGGINDSSGTAPTSKKYLYSHLHQLGMMNVKYILTDEELKDGALKKVYEENGLRIYKNAFHMPRYWIVERTREIKEDEELFASVQSPDFDPARTAYLEGPLSKYYGKPGKANRSSLEVISEKESEILLKVTAKEDSVLVLSQTHYPGWMARVDDGEETPLVRVNYLISGVPVAGGEHTVRIYYKPDILRILQDITKGRE